MGLYSRIKHGTTEANIRLDRVFGDSDTHLQRYAAQLRGIRSAATAAPPA